MFLAFFIKSDDRWRPLDIEPRGKGLSVIQDLDWNHIPFDEFNHFLIGVRNCTHLLAANSEGVKEIQQDHFVPCPCQGKSPVKILLPRDHLCHKVPPFCE